MKGIIFDFNGTMVFDSHFHDEAWRAFSTMLAGRLISDDEIENHVHGNVNEKIINYLLPHVGANENKRLSLKKEELYRELSASSDDYKFVEGLEAFLDLASKNKVPMTIASASIKENIDYFVETFQLNRWFDVEKIKYDNGSYKDKKQMFLDAAKAIGIPISQCIIIEDSYNGIACAKAVQPKQIIAIASGNKKTELMKDSQISFVIEDFNDERVNELLK